MVTWEIVLEMAEKGNPEPTHRIEKTDSQWQAILTDVQFQITRQAGTERPFSSEMCHQFESGVYHCVCCEQVLFDADSQFDSGSGWPSFTQPAAPEAMAYYADYSHGMTRVEVQCNVCDAHLGHVFPDGPEPSGLRYCMNAVAMRRA